MQTNKQPSADIWSQAPQVFASAKTVAQFVSKYFDRGLRTVQRDLSSKHQGKPKEVLCYPRSDGKGYDLKEVQRYISENHILPRGQLHLPKEEEAFEELAELKRRKLEAEERRLRAQADREELEFKARTGDLVPRESRDHELAQRVRFFRQDLRHTMRQAAPGIIQICDGKEEYLQDLKTHMATLVEGILSRYYQMAVKNDGVMSADEIHSA